MGRFAQKNMIFDDEDVLRDGYMPETLLERDEEMREYEEALQPTVNGARPRNIFVYGETGVGKTLATRIILDELEEDQKHFPADIETVWLNCKDHTSYQAACHLVNRFCDDTQTISTSGYPRSTVHELLWEEIETCDASHVLFVLDEVDSFGTDDELLYQIPRASSNEKVDNTEVGLIGISNNFKFRENLSGRVQSSLCEHEIHFSPYNANELETIIEQRAEKAFVDGALEDDVLPLTAALAGQDTGSARHALNILYKAGSLARKNDEETVTEQHVRDAAGKVERGIIEDELRALPQQSHILLYAILLLKQSGETPVRRTRIYETYEQVGERLGIDPKAPRTVHNRLSQLSLKGFLKVTESNKGMAGGKHHNYSLRVNEDILEDILRDDRRLEEAMTEE